MSDSDTEDNLGPQRDNVEERRLTAATHTGGRGRRLAFWLLFAVAEMFGLAAVIIVGVWMGKYRGGFAWTSNPQLEFNYHPLLMVTGAVFLYGNGIMIYRVFGAARKLCLKIFHMVIQAAVLVVSAVGLKAAFDSHNLHKPLPIPNLYSLHSWLGLATIILFSMQWLVGLVTFLLPFARDRHRAFVKPIHTHVGAMVFMFAIATCFAGMTEKLLWSLLDYSRLPPEGILANSLALVLLSFGMVVSFLVMNPAFRRYQLPSD